MPYVARVFTLRMASAIDIHNQLLPLTGQDNRTFPRIDNLVLNNNRITANVSVQYFGVGNLQNIETYHCVFDVNSRLVYIMGGTDGRSAIVQLLNRSIDPNFNVIEPRELTNENVIDDIFQVLRNQNARNFIKKMKLTFGIRGLQYQDPTPLYELEYRFVGNVCASTHVDYRTFVDNATSIKVNFGIYELGALERTDSPTSLGVSQDYSFRLWLDLPATDWIDLLDILTAF